MTRKGQLIIHHRSSELPTGGITCGKDLMLAGARTWPEATPNKGPSERHYALLPSYFLLKTSLAKSQPFFSTPPKQPVCHAPIPNSLISVPHGYTQSAQGTRASCCIRRPWAETPLSKFMTRGSFGKPSPPSTGKGCFSHLYLSSPSRTDRRRVSSLY